MTKRERRKAEIRASIETAARRFFASAPYEDAGLRQIAQAAGLTTGAIFSNYKDKADLWRHAMGTEPPVDRPVVRHADALGNALRALVAACRAGDPSKALNEAEAVLTRLNDRAIE